MKKMINDVRLMIKVCDLFYNRNVSQTEIARTLRISRPTVARLLASARKEGIVSIEVAGLDTVKHWSLENRLMERYGLRDAVVIDNVKDYTALQQHLAQATASYLTRALEPESVVGVSMGTTLHAVTQALPSVEKTNHTFIPLIGGMGQLSVELHAGHLAESFAARLGGTVLPLQAPARVSSPQVRAGLLKEAQIVAVLRAASQVDAAIVGIGYPTEDSAIAKTGYYDENEIESLLERGVAGDICMQFFNEDGDTAPYRDDNRVIGVELSRLKKVPLSIGIAGGKEKHAAIRGAVKGRYINVLITDVDCARALT